MVDALRRARGEKPMVDALRRARRCTRRGHHARRGVHGVRLRTRVEMKGGDETERARTASGDGERRRRAARGNGTKRRRRERADTSETWE